MKIDLDRDGPLIVRGAVVGTGILGLAIVARSVRMFTTFRHARQIPDDFFRKNMAIRGVVTFVTDNGLLRIDHKPIARVPFSKYFSNKNQEPARLAIELAGVSLTSSGAEWLKVHTLLKPITVVLIKRKDDAVLGDIYVKRVRAVFNKSEVSMSVLQGRLFKYSLNREIVRMGLGRIPDLTDQSHSDLFQSNAAYSRLVHNLIFCEKYADRRGVGMWKSSESTLRLPSSLREFYERFYSFWFYASDTMRTGLIPRFLYGFGAFLQQFSRITLNAIRIGSNKGLEAAKHLYSVKK